MIFSQINVLNLNLYILMNHIQEKLNKMNTEVLIDLKVNRIYVFLMITKQMLFNS